MSFVYILKNDNGRYYIGSTDNLSDRIRHHFGGYTPSTKRLGNLQLVFTQEYESLKEARSVELKLKKLKRHDYIASIVKDGFIKIKP
jgi:predicted GIY-YIG superfamily endonuclease